MLYRKTSRNRSLSKRRYLLEQLESRRLFAADLPSDMVADPYVFIGDHSWSDSEIWAMTVGDNTVTASGYGVVERKRLELAKGESYDIGVKHQGTKLEDGADYDYRAWIDNSANPAWTTGSSDPEGSDFFTDNSSGLLQRRHFGDDVNEATGTAILHIPLADFDIDSDESGSIDSGDDFVELDSTRGKEVIVGGDFEPVSLSLSENVGIAAEGGSIDVTIDYDMADLGQTNGEFRLWRVDNSQSPTLDDLIVSGQTYSADDLGLSPGSSISLYLEAVKTSRRFVHLDRLDVTVEITGRWDGTLEDYFHAKAVLFDVDIDTDSNNNGSIEEAEEAIEDVNGSDVGQVGRRIFINRDDDNKNGIQDSTDPNIEFVNANASDNNLAEVVIRFDTNATSSDLAGYSLILIADEGVRLWDNNQKLRLQDAVNPPTSTTGSGQSGTSTFTWELGVDDFGAALDAQVRCKLP